MENKFQKMNINTINQVDRWSQDGSLKVINTTELKNLRKGDYFIRVQKPKELNIVTFYSVPYIKYLSLTTYKEEATTQTSQVVKVVELNA